MQGAFLDHIPHFELLGVTHTVVRDRQSLSGVDRLVIPGGESTVMTKFLLEFNMAQPLKERIDDGMPVWGVCAGAILLSRLVDGAPGPLGVLPAAATRNAYGRQINSRQREIDIPALDVAAYPAIFIRAPRFDQLNDGVTVHARLDNDPVFIQHRRIMATTFHPELNQDGLFHRYFLSI